MLEPKNTLVGLAGQKAWHICTGEAAPRISGKYLPSQLRTQKAGPEPPATGAGWVGACELARSAKKLACDGGAASWRCGLSAPRKKSKMFSAESGRCRAAAGTATTMAAA